MKNPLSVTEQDNLRARGILKTGEIAYKEGEFVFAEDAVSGNKRMINVSQIVTESKDLLLG